MKPGTPNGDDDHGRTPRPKRRPRYAGTHPQRFAQRYKELNPDAYPGMHEHVRAQGRTPAGTHVPIMVAEVLEVLRPQSGDVVVDCTIGHGGHASALLERIAPASRLIGLDVDATQLRRTAQRLGAAIYTDPPTADRPPASDTPRIRLHRCHFGGIGKVLARERLDACDVILADLGVSSMQLDDASRGFSHKHDGPLDMRMDDRLPRTAADLLATLSVEELSAALRELADEPDHEGIARAIVDCRRVEPITRTRQLARLVLAAKKECARASFRSETRPSGSGSHQDRQEPLPHGRGSERTSSTQFASEDRLGPADVTGPPDVRDSSGATGGWSASVREQHPSTSAAERHPATRTFQALRMMVNDEIGGLEQLLRVAPYCLRPGGRLGIISFHSGEHRRVERAFHDSLHTGLYSAVCDEPLRPTLQEIHANPRSRAARLHWAVKTDS